VLFGEIKFTNLFTFKEITVYNSPPYNMVCVDTLEFSSDRTCTTDRRGRDPW